MNPDALPGVVDPVEETRRYFGERADAYRASASHGNPVDLARMLDLVGPVQGRALDVATGGGHTARALDEAGARVVATDVTPEMLRQLPADVPGVLADAHHLPFHDGAFDVVACRIAAHHFRDLPRFLGEAHRVLHTGGRFYVFDLTAPENPAAAEIVNRVERLRDPSHLESYSPSVWRRALEEAGFLDVRVDVGASEVDLEPWIQRARMPVAPEEELRRILRETPPDTLGGYGVTPQGRMRLLRVEVLARRPGDAV